MSYFLLLSSFWIKIFIEQKSTHTQYNNFFTQNIHIPKVIKNKWWNLIDDIGWYYFLDRPYLYYFCAINKCTALNNLLKFKFWFHHLYDLREIYPNSFCLHLPLYMKGTAAKYNWAVNMLTHVNCVVWRLTSLKQCELLLLVWNYKQWKIHTCSSFKGSSFWMFRRTSRQSTWIIKL